LRSRLLLALVLSGPAVFAAEPATLSFQDRVNAQVAIERVYYKHQVGVTKAFEQAVPQAVIEAKVRTYLKETSALEKIWNTVVTAEMLDHELRRMSAGSKMPARLRELYAALGNDPVLIRECLSRPSLVNRLTRNFFDFDATIHRAARAEADSLRVRLAAEGLRSATSDQRRTMIEVIRDRHPKLAGDLVLPGKRTLASIHLAPEDFDRVSFELPHERGEVGAVAESRDDFTVSVLLARDADHLRAAVYRIEKRQWEDWWRSVEGELSLNLRMPGSSPALATLEPAFRADCPADDTWEPTLDDAPEWRTQHAAVWTGSEMIVWGGRKAFFELKQRGLRYDPSIDSWAPVSLVDAPPSSYSEQSAVAVWASGRMIVLGQSSAAYDPASDSWAPLSTVNAPTDATAQTAAAVGSVVVVWGGPASGRRYDWTTDTWAAMATLNAPSARNGHTVMSTGTGVIVWGGVTDQTGGVYDLATDSWTAISTVGAPVPRTGHTATWTGDAMLIWGGYDIDGNLRDEGARYDPADDVWTPISVEGAPAARFNHSAVWGDGKLLIWGGNNWLNATLGTGGRYDPVTDEWSSMTNVNAPEPRREQVSVWTGDRMIVWGGTKGGDHVLNSGGRYDPVSDTWTPTSIGSTPVGRAIHTAIWTGASMIVWGGYSQFAPSPILDSGGRYDPATDNWLRVSQLGAPAGRYYHTSVWTGSEMIVWGGYAGYPTNFVNTGGRYDPIADTWSPTSTTNAPAAGPGHTAVWAGTSMFIWAGVGAGSGRYDPNLDSWSPVSFAGAPSAIGVAVWTGNVVVIWGRGVGGAGGGRYDPVANDWAPVSSIGAPSVRDAATGVWTGHEVIVWGGLDGPYNAFDTGGRYDPVADVWIPTSTVNAPARRFEHTAVWTGREMVVWGGVAYNDLLDNSGGRYDPNTDSWAPTSSANVPLGRHQHAAVWTGDVMVVTGGFGNEGGREEFSSGGRYSVQYDVDGDGYTACQGDCDDLADARHPGAVDNCNGIDDDCDAVVDNPETAVCDDGDLCTTGETCQAGACIAASSGLIHPAPKTSGYYRMLCLKRDLGQLPYQGDELTNADAICVGQLGATLAGVAVVDDICDVIYGGPQGGECAKSESELIATALNMCRARVCEAQRLDSRCHGNAHTAVSQSFLDADAILSDPARSGDRCRSATCELREINNGHALELNALVLDLAEGQVRLAWTAPILDDGSGTPSFYEIWRRSARSNEPFVRIGTTTDLSYRDLSESTGNLEYQLTAVMPGQ
jgi:N-acetylneuraminic acid mutarotase